jgi:glyoxylase-like metal-dependent hydrolase (beta-lactamase superfamily II)
MSATLQTENKRRFSRRDVLRFFTVGSLGAIAGGLFAHQMDIAALNAPPLPLPDTVQSASVSITTAAGMRVHAVQTGYVAVKTAHRQFSGADGMGLPAIASDQKWASWMPVLTWVIEHPEGVIVVDTGETAEAMDTAYFECDPVTAWIYRNNLRFSVTPADEIGSQLPTLGIDPLDVRLVVQTHLHSDHMGGLKSFPNADVIVPSADYPMSNGVLACHFPANFAPSFPNFTQVSLTGFPQGQHLTRDGDVILVPTPGHSGGHQSVLLLDGERTYCFAGDTSFDETQLLSRSIGGIVANPAQARQSLDALQAYAGSTPTVYLPTHDPDSTTRLREFRTTIV